MLTEADGAHRRAAGDRGAAQGGARELRGRAQRAPPAPRAPAEGARRVNAVVADSARRALRRADRGRRGVAGGRARRGLRPAGAQRRGQDDDAAGADDAAAGRVRVRGRWRATTWRPTPLAVRASIGYVPQALSRRRRADGGREPRLLRARDRRAALGAGGADRRGGRGDGARADARSPRAHVLRRHAAAAGDRDRAVEPARGAVPRRADGGARSDRARARVGAACTRCAPRPGRRSSSPRT